MEAVHTKNIQEWYDVQKFMVNRGKIWAAGQLKLDYSVRIHHGTRVCIIISEMRMTYGSIAGYTEYGYTILSFKEFIECIKGGIYG